MKRADIPVIDHPYPIRQLQKWRTFWDWLHCKAEELDVVEIGDLETPLKSFDVQVWLCEMWEEYHSLEETTN